MYPKQNTRFNELLLEGIAAVKRKNYADATISLTRATQVNPHDARPWIWLSETTDELDKKIDYLGSAVAADPLNSAARRGLAVLKGKIKPDEIVEPDQAEDSPSTNHDPKEVNTLQTYQCPNCGAQIKYSIEDRKLVCGHCGFSKTTHNQLASRTEAQVLDFVLPTQRGHSWADAQVHLTCKKCGATSIWPPGQTSMECPYCLSNHLVESIDTSEKIDPSAILLFDIDEDEARQAIAKWFRRGLTAPDDLVNIIEKIRLTHAYYPFWAIDGTLEFKWQCQVNEGSNDSPRWIPRSGTEYEIFDRILIPGNKKIQPETFKKLGKFIVDDLLTFQPQYLAGWPAISYDIPLSEASLRVREQVSKQVRRQLYARIEPNEEKRELRTGGLNWRDMTFKLALLPLYTGIYSYRKQDYHLFINGVTGEITGEMPRNSTKMVALVLAIILTGVLLVAIGLIALSFLGIL